MSAAVDIVIPVYNEEASLAASVRRLHEFLSDGFPYSWHITIADNASVDTTFDIARLLANELPAVGAVHLDRKGRGLALRETWSSSEAVVVAYMDVDLSTDLAALAPLVGPLLADEADVAIGSRLARGARVTRGLKREVISRAYNLLLKLYSGARFSDAQCGFKAVRRDAAALLVPMIEDNAWFFDTELLLLAEHFGLRIHEVAVHWVDDPDSRVDIVQTALDDLRGLRRMKRRFAATTADARSMSATAGANGTH
ncbi:MAG TPA: dolichyl-phosphate beta-glucosyltransferase [Acidimicrobiales bacterium]|nr:dolichyl-phosphate beta-glucosyltransferase [Acidimicrobiales bacterium]